MVVGQLRVHQGVDHAVPRGLGAVEARHGRRDRGREGGRVEVGAAVSGAEPVAAAVGDLDAGRADRGRVVAEPSEVAGLRIDLAAELVGVDVLRQT